MIAKFDSLFAGHIDMDDVGYGGTAVNDRRFSNERLVTVFDKARPWPNSWTGWATTRSEWPSTTFSTKATSACPTS